MMNDYMIFCGHYKTMTKANSGDEAKSKAVNLFKPKKNQVIGAWLMKEKDGGFVFQSAA